MGKMFNGINSLSWISNYNINRMQLTPYLYIDRTFISIKDFYQLIIFMYYDELSNKKIPGCYALINSKFENSYIEILKSYKNILIHENSFKLKKISITSDFEKPLINAINKVFTRREKLVFIFIF